MSETGEPARHEAEPAPLPLDYAPPPTTSRAHWTESLLVMFLLCGGALVFIGLLFMAL